MSVPSGGSGQGDGTAGGRRAARGALIAAAVLLSALAGAWVLSRGGAPAATVPAASPASNGPTASARLDDSPARPPADVPPGRLVVSENQRFLQHADGRPFFYLGDTAWELFHRLTREDVEHYLEDRRSKGFTVVQAVALAEQGGLSVPNAYGHLPLVDRDPTRPDVRSGPDDDYWDNVDRVVDLAGEKGLHVGFLPTWGDKVEKRWGWDGEPVFTVDNAYTYGRFLGERYRDTPNIIWILGGDRGPNSFDIDIWREMARGLRDGDGGSHLITYHPVGENTSSSHLHTDPLFDFNMLQSGHCATYEKAVEMVVADYERTPAKPVIDGEPHYEDHPVCFEPEQGWWDSHDARRSAYLQTFAGAFGHTYGHHSIWQFHAPGQTGASSVRTWWRDGLQHEGAAQVQHVRRLLESRPFFSRIPDQTVVVRGPRSGEGMVRATRSSDGSYLAVYAAEGGTFSVDLGALAGDSVNGWWYDPRTGQASEAWTFDNSGEPIEVDPPGSPGRTNDWVLVLDDASRGFPAPGTPLPADAHTDAGP